MPVPKLYTSGTLNAIKSEEENDSLDTVIRQAIVKDPLLPFSRTGDNPVQWFQLLHALDQPDLAGWPLMTPVKVQMQKCEKCSREFCSSINYRRHIRVHRRSLNVNKESDKHRGLLAAFWDKLSLEEAMEVVSFGDVSLKEIPGTSVIVALTSFLHQPGVWALPQFYVKAGSTLLDIIQGNPSRLPSSEELFNILDDASERTFLCAGTAESVQKYLFAGEAAKNNLELKNLVACTSFLFEQKLVKAWLAEQDAEALRCQKLLVEEEEAAQKRQAELLERKKQKKLRRKEQKMKEEIHGCKGDLNVVIALSAADGPVSTEAYGLSSPSDSCSNSEDMATNLDPGLETMQLQIEESEKDLEAQIDSTSEFINQGHTHNIEPQIVSENDSQHLTTNNWQEVSNSQRVADNGFHECRNLQILEPNSVEIVGVSSDLTGNKVLTEKHKTEGDEKSLKPPFFMEETNYQVVIGSIPIVVRSCSAQQKKRYLNDSPNTCSSKEAEMLKQNASGKLVKADSVSHGDEPKGISPAKRGDGDSEDAVLLEKVSNQIISTCKACCANKKHYGNDVQGHLRFNSAAAKEFLIRRWKEAISGDHVKLVYSSVCETPNVQHDNAVASTA
ncbi:hypothetical protein ABFS82_06G108200 [Erythranthe guttata]